MPDGLFTTHGDEPVEARIVAWVLGEASAFEAAELERLCDERPELMIFKRRMLALHGLLAEAETATPDDNKWKLPKEKRKTVDEIFGQKKPIRLEVDHEKRIRHNGRRALLAIAACVIFTVIILGLSAPMVIRQRKKSDVTEARSREMQMELAALEAENMQRLRTELPKELIEGTPKPMNVPNLESPVSGPAGSATWSMAERSRGSGEADERNAEPARPAAPPMPSAAPASRRVMAVEASSNHNLPEQAGSFGKIKGELVQRQPRPRSRPEPSEPVAETAPASDADPFADEGASTSRLSARQLETKTGSGTLSLNSGGVIPADELISRGNRDGSGSIEMDKIAGNRRNDAGSAGEKAPVAKAREAPADMPVLGRLFPEDDKSDLSLGSDYYESNGRLSGTNTYSGGTAVTGGALGFGDSGGGFAEAAPDAQPAASGKVDDSVSFNEELYQDGKKKDEGKLVGGIEIVGGSKFELKPGNASEYHFKSADLGEDKATNPDDAESLASEAEKQQEMQKVLKKINEMSAMVADLDEVKLRAEAALETDSNNAQARNVLNKISELKKSKEQAKPSLTDIASEIPAVEEPYSTFSLNISDASFQIAQAALAKGERPAPAGIKVEQFYNAVDYGDPAPAANESVAVNIEQSAHPVIPGRNLVRIALKTAAAGRSAAQPLRLTLLVDQSGSMVREDRRAAMDKALAGLSELLTKNDLVTVIGFSRTPRLLADGMTGDKAGKLAELVNQSASEGGTNLEEAIKLGEQLADRRKLAGAQNRIVLFTDGAANLGNADPERLAEKVKQLRQKGIAFDIAGIAADGLNDELLGELARNGNGRYYVVGKGADANFAKQLAGAFRPAAENVKVQVRFNPERVGRYKLIGFEKDRLKTEDFRNDKVDAAELAAEEAGVAIYQVETLPEGNGELGEVSVRFRDTTRGEMVERAWTIPHDTSAQVLDRATPSMQLAVLSMLAGEKLKGGPLADAIDFKQLIESIANVKQFYGNTGRVGGMLRVVDALK